MVADSSFISNKADVGGAVEACAAPPKPEWQRSADAHPNDLGRLVVPDVT